MAGSATCPSTCPGELTVEVTRRIPLDELPALHAEGAAGRIAGKVVVLPG